MAESLIGATIKITLEKVVSFATGQIGMIWGFQEDLERLGKTVNTILAVVDDAEEKQVKDGAVKLWLKELEELAYLAVHVLDEVNYEMLRRRVEDQNCLKGKVRLFSSHNTIVFRFRMARKIKNINTEFELINKRVRDLGLQSQLAAGVSNRTRLPTIMGSSSRETDSIVGREVIGRENDASKIVVKLLSPSNEPLSIIPITGMGGLGKTTLAQIVCNKEQIVKHFDHRIWVYVSENFEPKRIFKMMLESLPRTSDAAPEGRDNLVQKIKKKLEGKRYLLVLDDVWNENSESWNGFLCSLTGISSTLGNWIIVTTRQQQVASILSERHRIPLGKLSDEKCLCIVKEKARLPAGVVPEFETIRLKITELCQGLPLAASVIGGLLRMNPREEWHSVLQKGISNMSGDEYSSVTQILNLSFDHLSLPSVKKCFAYCSLFEKGSHMEKDELIELWMAAGFLQPNNDNDMEKGNQYINILLHNSLLQEVINEVGHSTLGMHDLVHDLVQSKNDLKDVNCQGRYLVVDSLGEETKTLPKKKMRMLHTLFFRSDIADDMLVNFKHLCVLKLSWVKEVPTSIGKLIHLRYFELSHSTIKALPKALCKLYNLQTLRIRYCDNLRTLPKDMAKLVSLRHLHCDMDLEMPPNIGQLACLQTLEFFKVRQEKGYQIKELGCLENIKGKLSISNLERVNGKEEAMQAGLYRKEIKILEFNWSGEGENDEGVLEGLQPRSNLQELSIKSFLGSQFPSWSTTLDRLTSLSIIGCKRCEQLPALGKLPLLKYLKLEKLDYISCIDPSFYGTDDHSGSRINIGSGQVSKKIFPTLRCLEVLSMKNLKEWMEPKIANDEVVNVFPNLEDLTIQNCNQLSSTPIHHFLSLKRLSVFCVGLDHIWPPVITLGNKAVALPSLEIERNCSSSSWSPPDLTHVLHKGIPTFLESMKISDCENLGYLPNYLYEFQSLRHLEIYNCSNLNSLPNPSGWQRLTSLQRLHISECHGLTSLPSELLHSCASLQDLEIRGCNGLTSLPSELLHSCASLQDLEIRDCNGLTSLPSELLHSCASLQDLEIRDCNGLTSLPSELLHSCASLQDLEIQDCNGLTSLPSELLHSCASLQDLRIRGCNGLTSLPSELLHSCASLQDLEIRGCNGLTSLPSELLHSCASLQDLQIRGCNGLTSLPSELLHSCASLQDLGIWDCDGLTSLPSELLHSCASLQDLRIRGCNGLTSLPSELLHSCASLQALQIWNCDGLTSLPSELLHSCASLQGLRIWDCDGLTSLPSELLHSCASLQGLRIWDCDGLTSLPSELLHSCASLQGLRIWGCDGLTSLPSELLHSCASLQGLEIWGCDGLTSLPSELLHSCASLQGLRIWNCNGLTSLPSELLHSCASLQGLEISGLGNLDSFPFDLHQIPSLSTLKIGEFSDSVNFNWSALSSLSLQNLELDNWPHLVSLSDQLQHLTALRDLKLRKLGQIEALPDWFANLVSLETLVLWDCENLCYLPSVAAMRSLIKLSSLDIYQCPLLKERCTRRNDPSSEWTKIAHISSICIDGDEFK